eukprot:scaffold16857_cov52-Phaeocystis_antarctica.AAC.4
MSEAGRRNSSSPSSMGAEAKTPRPRSPSRTSSVELHSAPRSQHQSRRLANMGLRVVLAARRNIIKCRNQTKAGDLVCGELLNAERREKTPQTRPLHDKLKHASATARHCKK